MIDRRFKMRGKLAPFFLSCYTNSKSWFNSLCFKNIVELTELIKDYVATELLSSIEIDFLEGELWETTQHIAEINTVIKAPKNICKKLGLDEKSCWQLCCAAVLDFSRPLKNGQNRVDDFKKLINQYEISYI